MKKQKTKKENKYLFEGLDFNDSNFLEVPEPTNNPLIVERLVVSRETKMFGSHLEYEITLCRKSVNQIQKIMEDVKKVV